jgi:1-deoxy-D-xylulose-5-phosphate reductoisomerase
LTRILTILGSTGSIGTSTLDVVRHHAGKYLVHCLAAGENADLLSQQILEFRPSVAIAATEAALDRLSIRLTESGLPRREWPELLTGSRALIDAATAPETDFVMSAIVGVTGLEATYEAIRAGKRVGLANKEVLVAAGEVVMRAARESGAEMIPVDSEHNGVHQCLRGGRREDVAKVVLTASGGPFRNHTAAELEEVTPEQALKHPTWKMGNRITVDSATLMNKGFEVMEACWLFGLAPDRVEVVIHPQSAVHALVEFNDGSTLAQISAADMRMPIQYALTYPERAPSPVSKVDWSMARTWDFHPPDTARFPLLALAYRCLEAGGSAGCILNAADEVAVESFLQGRIGFSQVPEVVEDTLSRVPPGRVQGVGVILETDAQARSVARELVAAKRNARTGAGRAAR